jgi:hypothetical protein
MFRQLIESRRLQHQLTLLSAALLLLLSMTPMVFGQTDSVVSVPLTIDYAILRAEIVRQLYTEDGRADFWSGANSCQFLYGEHPLISPQGGQLLFSTDTSLSIGLPVGKRCLSPVRWTGIAQVRMIPYLAGRSLKFRVADVNLFNARHEKTLIAGRGFDLVKRYVIPRLETFTFDLNPATRTLEQLARAAASPAAAARIDETMATMRVGPGVEVQREGLGTVLQVTLPAQPQATPAPLPAPLSPAEIAAFETKLDQWDAFLVFAVKQLAGSNGDAQLRAGLLELLLDSRYRLLTALENPQAGGPDPVRTLFLQVWRQLGVLVRAAAQRDVLGDRSVEFLSFISAGDALFALDQTAPVLGMRISADDLRYLARMMAPGTTVDPLAFSFAEDPELRRIFGIGPTAQGLETPTAPSGLSAHGASATPAPATPSAAPTPTPLHSDVGGLQSLPGGPLMAWLEALLRTPVAYGGDDNLQTAGLLPLRRVANRLGRTVADAGNVGAYEPILQRLLEMTATYAYRDADPGPADAAFYVHLVKAVAWQESCWRQFVKRGQRVVYLESPTHDIGLMQVNKYVWRGFYSIPRLEWDIVYNASAGTQILLTLQKQIGAGGRFGSRDQLARSLYAAYNGGPEAYRRWREKEAPVIRAIDQSFWAKYQALGHGQRVDILSCAVQWDASHQGRSRP